MSVTDFSSLAFDGVCEVTIMDRCFNYVNVRLSEDYKLETYETPASVVFVYNNPFIPVQEMSREYAFGILLGHEKEDALRTVVTMDMLRSMVEDAEAKPGSNFESVKAECESLGVAVYELPKPLTEAQLLELERRCERGAGNAIAIYVEDCIGSIDELFNLALLHCSKKDLNYLSRADEMRRAPRDTYTAARMRLMAQVVNRWIDAHSSPD
jgi:hypothetical protein